MQVFEDAVCFSVELDWSDKTDERDDFQRFETIFRLSQDLESLPLNKIRVLTTDTRWCILILMLPMNDMHSR